MQNSRRDKSEGGVEGGCNGGYGYYQIRYETKAGQGVCQSARKRSKKIRIYKVKQGWVESRYEKGGDDREL